MSINDDTPGTNFPHKFCFFSWPGTGCFFQRANQPGCAPRGCPAPQYSNQPPTAGRTASVAKTEGDACVSRPALSVVALAPHRFYCKRCHVNTHIRHPPPQHAAHGLIPITFLRFPVQSCYVSLFFCVARRVVLVVVQMRGACLSVPKVLFLMVTRLKNEIRTPYMVRCLTGENPHGNTQGSIPGVPQGTT